MKPPRTRSRPTAPPTLHNGDRLSQPEFHRRYQAYPEDTTFELVGGVVYMASPMREPHGLYTSELNLVLALYKAATPGVLVAENVTTILGENNEPQPDLVLRLLPECGGQSRTNENGYLVGAPELVAEVAHSSIAIDLHAKHDAYLAAGVQEYLVLCVEEQEIRWFHFPSKRQLKADKAGLWKSRVFPGLWIDGAALLARDSARLIAAVQQGLASGDHAKFAAKLQARRKA